MTDTKGDALRKAEKALSPEALRAATAKMEEAEAAWEIEARRILGEMPGTPVDWTDRMWRFVREELALVELQHQDEAAPTCSGHYRAVEFDKNGNTKEGVQYVGVYLLKWQQEWGQPEVAFVEVDDD